MARAADPQEISSWTSGAGMVVERYGGGPPVLLIHGLGGAMMWEKLIPLLAPSREVIVPHLRGFGESSAPERKMSSGDHARLLLQLVRDFGLSGGVTLAGISYGGAIAARLAAISPLPPERLVLICPTGFRAYPGYLRSGMFGRMLTRKFLRWTLSQRGLADRLSLRSFHDPRSRPADLVDRYLAQLRREGHQQALEDACDDIAQDGLSLPGLLHRLPSKTMIVWGENDRVLPAGVAVQLVRGDDKIDFSLISECGHSVPMENPQALFRILTGSFTQDGNSTPCPP